MSHAARRRRPLALAATALVPFGLMALPVTSASAAAKPVYNMGTIVTSISGADVNACTTSSYQAGVKQFAVSYYFNNNAIPNQKNQLSIALYDKGSLVGSASTYLNGLIHTQPKALGTVARGTSSITASARVSGQTLTVTRTIDPAQLPDCASNPDLWHLAPEPGPAMQACTFSYSVYDDVNTGLHWYYHVLGRGNNHNGTDSMRYEMWDQSGADRVTLLDSVVAPGDAVYSSQYSVQPAAGEHLFIRSTNTRTGATSTQELNPNSLVACGRA